MAWKVEGNSSNASLTAADSRASLPSPRLPGWRASYRGTNMANQRFKAGSGCYRCRLCHHLTRATGDGEGADLLLCELCYEIASLENEASDHGDPTGSIATVVADL